jgi:hypothetical protein
MTQERLNNVALLHCHRDYDINIENIANEFISRSAVRQNTFAV